MEGRCHCGAVRVEAPAPPADVTECRCSICRRYETLWAYYRVDDVRIEGPTVDHMWGPKRIVFQRCGVCGCVMAWRPRGAYPECGVNARMFERYDVFPAERVVEDDASL